jgi:hypothetical protein
MSTKRKINVPKIVEKYRQAFPGLEKRYIRRLIRSENKELFQKANGLPDEAQIKKLTRALQASYKEPPINLDPEDEKTLVNFLKDLKAGKMKIVPTNILDVRLRSLPVTLETEPSRYYDSTMPTTKNSQPSEKIS